MANDLLPFLAELIRNPREVSAIVPSSRALARGMVEAIGPSTGKVAEFGPGTGRITRAILERGVDPKDLTLFEMNPRFCERLSADFPGVRIENRPAQDLASAGVSDLGAVVSGLPLLSIPVAIQKAIFAAAFAALRPDGAMMQFTYGPRPPLDPAITAELDLSVSRGPYVWWNLPPATVYVYTRRSAARQRAA